MRPVFPLVVLCVALGLLGLPAAVEGVISTACEDIPHCTVCEVTRDTAGGDPVTGDCHQCRNGRFLHEGACHDSCDGFDGYRPHGQGSLNRACLRRCLDGTTYDSTPQAAAATCVPVSPCPEGEVEVSPATAARDRICQAVGTICGNLAGTSSRNPRRCLLWSILTLVRRDTHTRTASRLPFGCPPCQGCTYADGELEYRGSVAVTQSGRACQSWASQKPHSHGYTQTAYPDAGLGTHSFCRNPNGEAGLWCYTQDPLVTWE